MANFRSKIAQICVFLSLVSLSSCGVPVLIWESNAISRKEDMIPALAQLDTDEFSNFIVKKVHIHKPLIAVFLEESLSVEDFSWQDDQHRGSFPQIQNITSMSAKIEFIPSVEEPVDALKDLTITQEYAWKKYDDSKLPNKPGVVLEVKLKDPLPNEDRPDMLRRHDANIAQIYSQLLAEHSHIIAIFTGKQSSWVEPEINRVRRDVNDTVSSPQFSIVFPEKALIVSKEYPELSDGEEVYSLKNLNTNIPPDVRTALLRISTTFTTGTKKFTLRFRFEKLTDKWLFREVEYEKSGGDANEDVKLMLRATQDISAPLGSSFKSESPIEFSNGTVVLTFKDLQVEPWPRSIEFSETYADNQFFTAGIWSGLFVTFILALIFTWGITMLMDVRTMDRFDDPKGKTISVNVAE